MVKAKHAAWVVLEVVCLLCAVAGVALVYLPAALIVGGVAGVVCAERATADRGGGRRR
ncbi:hypothetical protein [Streptomyces tricolor]|uniref:hypothetical protein n=1 Tax=Streptomyces tricolor TaxID=68277 RepID=UPI0013028246|nr:hypothetical protein [Streptomyces tricolor]